MDQTASLKHKVPAGPGGITITHYTHGSGGDTRSYQCFMKGFTSLEHNIAYGPGGVTRKVPKHNRKLNQSKYCMFLDHTEIG